MWGVTSDITGCVKVLLGESMDVIGEHCLIIILELVDVNGVTRRYQQTSLRINGWDLLGFGNYWQVLAIFRRWYSVFGDVGGVSECH